VGTECVLCHAAVTPCNGFVVAAKRFAEGEDGLIAALRRAGPEAGRRVRRSRVDALMYVAARRPEEEWLLCGDCAERLLPGEEARDEARRRAGGWWERQPAAGPAEGGEARPPLGVFPDGPLPWFVIVGAVAASFIAPLVWAAVVGLMYAGHTVPALAREDLLPRSWLGLFYRLQGPVLFAATLAAADRWWRRSERVVRWAAAPAIMTLVIYGLSRGPGVVGREGLAFAAVYFGLYGGIAVLRSALTAVLYTAAAQSRRPPWVAFGAASLVSATVGSLLRGLFYVARSTSAAGLVSGRVVVDPRPSAWVARGLPYAAVRGAVYGICFGMALMLAGPVSAQVRHWWQWRFGQDEGPGEVGGPAGPGRPVEE